MNTGGTYEKLPSGKVVIKEFDSDGQLIREQQTYGFVEIGIWFSFLNGVKTDETYFSKKRMVSRETYQKARLKYTDMPPPDTNMEDGGGKFLKFVLAQRKQRIKASSHHKPDPAVAAESDAFCVGLSNEGKRADASQWIQDRKHTLGEMGHNQSTRLVSKLLSFGCKQVLACKIDSYDDSQENTGHLVVDLPEDKSSRDKVLRQINKIAERLGYEGPMDDGQRYAYIKLD